MLFEARDLTAETELDAGVLMDAGDDLADFGADGVSEKRRGDVELVLRPKEFDLLTALTRHAGEVVTREALMSDVWDEHWDGPTKTLDVHVTWIRAKLKDAGGDPTWITTVRGVGLRFENG